MPLILIVDDSPTEVHVMQTALERHGYRTAVAVDGAEGIRMARQMHPGQRNGLDALCKRYSVDNSHRDLHGALLDADLLLEVYLAMTGGQGALTLGETEEATSARKSSKRAKRPRGELRVVRATQEEIEAHEQRLVALDRASGGRTVWRTIGPAA